MLFKQGLVALAALIALATIAHADTSFIQTKPSNTIPVGTAAKSKTPVAKCDKVKLGSSGRPKKVAGSTTFWLAEMPKQDESATAQLEDGKAVFQCKSMEFDLDKGRMSAATAE